MGLRFLVLLQDLKGSPLHLWVLPELRGRLVRRVDRNHHVCYVFARSQSVLVEPIFLIRPPFLVSLAHVFGLEPCFFKNFWVLYFILLFLVNLFQSALDVCGETLFFFFSTGHDFGLVGMNLFASVTFLRLLLNRTGIFLTNGEVSKVECVTLQQF